MFVSIYVDMCECLAVHVNYKCARHKSALVLMKFRKEKQNSINVFRKTLDATNAAAVGNRGSSYALSSVYVCRNRVCRKSRLQTLSAAANHVPSKRDKKLQLFKRHNSNYI